ncbi:hypothetical protein ACQP3L_37405, partial [Escherichia coli]
MEQKSNVGEETTQRVRTKSQLYLYLGFNSQLSIMKLVWTCPQIYFRVVDGIMILVCDIFNGTFVFITLIFKTLLN